MNHSESQANPAPSRAAFYVDGFNLFHAVEDLGEPHLKWLNLKKLGDLIIPSATETIVRMVYCTAFYPNDSEKKWRHQQYINALEVVGVTVEMGHFIYEPADCRGCGRNWDRPVEKEGDINVALHLINDAWLDRFDHAYLISADSDQAATARLFRAQFPNKKLTSVSPPNRNFSYEVTRHGVAKISLDKSHIERCLFPQIVPDVAHGNHGRRPREYNPPAGWVAPP